MKLEKITKKENNRVELEITVPAAEFDAACEAAYKKNIKRMNIQGFRPGKAPRKMVEKMYGEGVFYEDAINSLYPDAYEAAVKEAGIEPVDRADVDVLDMGAGKDFKFKATVTVKPEITVKEYKGLKIEKTPVVVTDEDVEAELGRYQARQSRLITVADRKSALGDTVEFDFEGFVDGKAFEGGKAENYSLKLGSGQFIPGFEDQMVGHKAGDEFSVNVKFPDDYTEELKGKDAEFKIKLHEIKIEELPELNDEFAKDVSEFDTLDAFKADLRAKLTEQKNKDAESEVDYKLADAIAALCEGDVPACMFEQEIDINMQNFERRLMSQGLSLQKYAELTGQELSKMRDAFRPNAEMDVKMRLALEKIASLEGIIVEDKDIEEAYKNLADATKKTVEEIRCDYVTENITKDLIVQKAYDAVRAAAEITEAKAKKPAAKKTAKKAEPAAEKASAEKKPAAKKTTAKKADAEAVAEKPAAKKTTAKKAAPKADAEKKPAAKKTTKK